MKDCPIATSLVAQALNVDPTAVDENVAPGVTPEWDSLAHMRLILKLEGHLGRQLTPQQIVAITGMRDVIAVIETGL